MFDKINRWYKQGLWTAEMVQTAANKGVITQAQADEITGRGLPEPVPAELGGTGA